MFSFFRQRSHCFSCYFQVILQSEVKATLTIYDAWLDLQDGFIHTGKGDGRPTPGFFPLVISPNSRAGILFSICLEISNAEGIFMWTSVLYIFLIAVVSCTSEVIRKPFQCLRTGNHITTLIERDTGVLISHHSSRVFYL